MFLEYAGDVEASHVHVQFVAWFPSPEGGRVARCMTRRIPVAPSMPAYLRGVDSSVAAVLAAKKAALDAQSDAVGPKEARKRVEARVLDVADVFAPRDADGGSLHDPFPRELGDFAEAMYHLLRGPMLGTLAGHEDERAAMRQLFLGRGVGAGLWFGCTSGAAGTFSSPAGGPRPQERARACARPRHGCLRVDRSRRVRGRVGGAGSRGGARGDSRGGKVPVPRVRMFREGSSQARYMCPDSCRYIGAPHEQDAMFPLVRSLYPNERKARWSRVIPPTDDFSFFSRVVEATRPRGSPGRVFSETEDDERR